MQQDKVPLATIRTQAAAFERPMVPVQRPVELLSFSYDNRRQLFMDDDRQMTYYLEADLNTSLNEGFPDKFEERDESVPEHLDALVHALWYGSQQSKDPAVEDPAGWWTADVITWRGIMTKICCTPYESREGWLLHACRHNGSVFIEEHKLPESNVDSERNKKWRYWGYRFETVSTVSASPKERREHGPEYVNLLKQARLKRAVNTNEQYCIVARTKINRTSIIMGAEVDCTLDDKVPNDPARNYVELKTSRIIEGSRMVHNFEKFKLLKFYIQSFLVAVPNIYVGFRDDEGILKQVTKFKTLEIPRLVRGKRYWDPAVCMNFAETVLNQIRKTIVNDDPTDIYAIEYHPETCTVTISRTTDIQPFLPAWFLDKTEPPESNK